MSQNEEHSIYRELLSKSKTWSVPIDSMEFARMLDAEDPLRDFRNLFHYPKKRFVKGVNLKTISDENDECIYFCGQSLGLQLKSITSTVIPVLGSWALRGAESYFTGEYSTVFCDQRAKKKMAKLVGAETSEIAFMNGLTVNVHLMIASFYRPSGTRNKILMLDFGFSSDLHAIQSQVALRGLDPQEIIIFMKPKQGSHTIDKADILSFIKKEGKHISLIYFEGVHYFTGQLFDIKSITKAGHEQGCVVGYDLAHTVGNVKLHLHDWNVDFAVWCTYKYLNSGPGGIGGVFCHNKHTHGVNQVHPMLKGWWGLDYNTRFNFGEEIEFSPAEGADRFRISNPSPIHCAIVSRALDVFDEAGMDSIQEKQRLLTGYLEHLIRNNLPMHDGNCGGAHVQIITPSNPRERGSQISISSSVPIHRCEELLREQGILCDVRSSSVLRITPAPLYNTFIEVFKFVHVLKNIWKTMDENKTAE